MRSRILVALLAALCASMLSGCAAMNAFSVNAIPLPGSSYREGYDVVVEFANVLNLPDRAKVLMDGRRVGVLKDISLSTRGVDVTVRVDGAMSIPSNIHAVIQQATVLGDTYVALELPANEPRSSTIIGNGGRIPLAQTTSPPQIEDTMANLANFIGSGSIQRAQNSIIGINRVTPPRPEVRAISARVATDLSDLANNIGVVDRWLDGLAQSGQVMANHAADFKYWFSSAGLTAFHHSFSWSHFFAPLLPTIGSIYWNGYWLDPFLSSLANAFQTVQHSKWAFESEIHRWEHLVTDQLLPEQKYPAINIVSIVGPGGGELIGNVDQVLGMIGAKG